MTRRKTSLTLIFCIALAACGGGGGVNSTPTPSPSPTPTPSPSPTPTAINFDTAEYRRSNGAVFHEAITAWQEGASGEGVTVGVIDTGIDIPNPEFSGRISSASRAFGGNSSYQDEDGHGTAVTGVLAAPPAGPGVKGNPVEYTNQAPRPAPPAGVATSAVRSAARPA